MRDEAGDARIRRQIAQRLSLRRPQEEALEALDAALAHVDFTGARPLAEVLAAMQAGFPTLADFERDFPSLCFALATGVGKTRLMGAFISQLFLTGRSRNFFVLAPNTTIYDKLVADFSRPNAPKYVFRGIGEFAQNPPVIVTGDTWDEGRGVRGSDLFGGDAVINIFNVDKINKEAGRIRGFRETIGASYFEYLSSLPDLVLLMDEAHRYRARAATRAIFDLKPKLGLELTATPKTVGARPQDFRNVVYAYGLGQAMADGYVKEPAEATRANFVRANHTPEQVERIMLEDGVHYHEHVRTELDLHARQTGQRRVHPFMLVVAKDTAHAGELKTLIESEDFFGGRYAGRVAEIHSNLKGEESDEATARLLALESDDRTDIVIHVNKLKEGWDVTNLYTIVPLRASASDILTEQTLGRGLRLPYGERTGNATVDTLTVIAHDRFDQVIEAARAADSVLRVPVKELTIGEGGDVTPERQIVAAAPPTFVTALTGRQFADGAFGEEGQTPYVFETPQERALAQTAIDIIQAKYEALPGGVRDLQKPEVRALIVRDVERLAEKPQGELDMGERPNLVRLVIEVTRSIAENTIEIPEIVVLPSREVNFWFEDFDLSGLEAIRYQPSNDPILILEARTGVRRELARALDGPREDRVEDYVVKFLIDDPRIDYDSQADLLYKLAGQATAHLASYLGSAEDVENVALAHGRDIARFILSQMDGHYRETPAEYRARVVRSYRSLVAHQFAFTAERRLPLTQPAQPLSATPATIFYGSRKSPYQQHKFHSDAERRFACILDSEYEPNVLRWLKPASRQFQIEWKPGREYEPDFVVETTGEKLMVEVKADRDLADNDVVAKQRAARAWIENANALARETNAKPWRYVLVAESAINGSATFGGLVG